MLLAGIVSMASVALLAAPYGGLVGEARAAGGDPTFRDPGLNDAYWINFIRAPGTTSGYKYSVHYYPCNIDDFNTWSGSIKYEFELHNNGNGGTNSYVFTYGPVVYSSIAPNDCANSHVLPLIDNYATLYCCGTGRMYVINGTDSNTNNNQAGDNELYIAMSASSSRVLAGNILNWDTETHDFDIDVDDATVPSGWSVTVVPSTLEVAAEWQGYYEITVESPASITEWPTIDIWATLVGGGEFLSQSTRIDVLDAGTYDDDDPCAEWQP